MEPNAAPVEFNPHDPLALVAGETPRANEALRRYVELGPRRSLAAVGKLFGHREKSTAEAWSRRWRWQERLAAWLDMQGRAADRALSEFKATARVETLEQIREIEQTARDAYRQSRGPDGKRRGDPRFLKVRLDALADMRELLGLDAPKKAEIGGRLEASLDAEVLIAKKLSDAAERLGDARVIDLMADELDGAIGRAAAEMLRSAGRGGADPAGA